MKARNLPAVVPFYRQQGDGTPVVALHGSASTGGQWSALMARLEDKYRIIAPDLPGYGASCHVAAGARSTIATSARSIAGLVIDVGEPVHLVGHSYGGAVALHMTLTWPELVRTLTLVEPASFHFLNQGGPADKALYAEIAAVAGVMSACAADDAADVAMAHFVDYWNGEATWSRLSADQRTRLKPQLGAVLSNFATGFADTIDVEACATLSCPVQLIMGLQSRAPAQRVTEMIAEAVPQARLTLVGDAGHMSPVTHPGVVNMIIADHIAAAEDRQHRRNASRLSPRLVA